MALIRDSGGSKEGKVLVCWLRAQWPYAETLDQVCVGHGGFHKAAWDCLLQAAAAIIHDCGEC